MSLGIFDDGAEAREKVVPRRRKRRKGWIVFWIVLALTVGLVVSMGMFYLGTLNKSLNNIKREPAYVPTYQGRPAEPEVANNALNFVLLGSDSRGRGDVGRSDAIMWLHVAGDRKKMYLISFTRDMWVNIPGYRQGKINWALAFGGVPLQVRTLEELIGARANHVASIDFDGFMKLTDILGGVTVYNKYDSGIDGYTFPKGELTLSGEKALVYVRERYKLPQGAWSRAERQRDVMQAITMKILSPATLANPVTFGKLVEQIATTVKVDANVTNKLLYDTALSMKISKRADIVSLQAPITGGGKRGDQYVDEPNFEQLKELGKALTDDKMAEYVAKHK